MYTRPPARCVNNYRNKGPSGLWHMDGFWQTEAVLHCHEWLHWVHGGLHKTVQVVPAQKDHHVFNMAISCVSDSTQRLRPSSPSEREMRSNSQQSLWDPYCFYRPAAAQYNGYNRQSTCLRRRAHFIINILTLILSVWPKSSVVLSYYLSYSYFSSKVKTVDQETVQLELR